MAQYYEARFSLAMCRLNVRSPTLTQRVTQNVHSVVAYVEKLVQLGYAYSTVKGLIHLYCGASGKMHL